MVIFWVLLGLIACERVAELVVSARHAKALLGRGGVEYGFGHFPVMIVLHVGLIAGCVLEPLLAGRTFLPVLGFPMLALTVLANVLRWWCISTLGERWTARVIVLPGAPLVRSGPYRWFAHPNYVAVIVEGFALPLTGSAWITATAFTVLNAALLTVRIRCEVRALAAAAPGAARPPAMPVPGTAASWPAGDALPGSADDALPAGTTTPDAGNAGTEAADSAGIS
jgi:methyltransferase